jgi:phenylpyruvate tautomerase PptA (4-oxalocrotonate tautomerase family)
MPMIELTLPQGALDKPAQDDLMEKLTLTLLRWEGAPPESDAAKDVSWGYVDEKPASNVYHRGRPQPEQPLYRVKVTVPERALDDERKTGLVAEMTRHVLGAEGASPDDEAAGMRVWVIVREVPDGNWGGAGRIWRLRDIARLVMGGRDRERTPA